MNYNVKYNKSVEMMISSFLTDLFLN